MVLTAVALGACGLRLAAHYLRAVLFLPLSLPAGGGVLATSGLLGGLQPALSRKSRSYMPTHVST